MSSPSSAPKVALKAKPTRAKRKSLLEAPEVMTVPLDDGTNTEFHNGVSRNGTVRLPPSAPVGHRPAIPFPVSGQPSSSSSSSS